MLRDRENSQFATFARLLRWRIDCYRAVADGAERKRRIGWSKMLAALRVKFPRVRAP